MLHHGAFSSSSSGCNHPRISIGLCCLFGIVFCASQIYFRDAWLRKPTWLPNPRMLFSSFSIDTFSRALSLLAVSQSIFSFTEFLHSKLTSTSPFSIWCVPWVTIHIYCTPAIIRIHVFIWHCIYWLACALHNVLQHCCASAMWLSICPICPTKWRMMRRLRRGC
jgi:hypothetical protein